MPVLRKLLSWIRNFSWKKRIIFAVVMIVVVAGLVWKSQATDEKGYTFDTVSRHNITEVVSESGNISVAGKTEVFSPTNGIIEEVYVKNGDLVGQDQELFKVVSTATEDDRIAALAALTAKQAALKTAQQNKVTLQAALETARKAVLDAQTGVDDRHDALTNDPNVYSQVERDSIESSLTSARLSFTAAEKAYVEADVAIGAAASALASAQLDYDSTKDRVIKSPTIGTVSNLSVAANNSIQAAGGITNLPALTIANFSSNQIILDINEADIAKIMVGQSATIYPDAIDTMEYMGVVSRIDDIGQDSEGVITFKVYVDIVNPDDRIKSGMTVDVDILTQEIANTLAVPNAAIKPYQGGKSVRILNRDSGELENLPVIVGIKGETYTQILEGISEGQEIVVSLSNDKVKRSGPLGF